MQGREKRKTKRTEKAPTKRVICNSEKYNRYRRKIGKHRYIN